MRRTACGWLLVLLVAPLVAGCGGGTGQGATKESAAAAKLVAKVNGTEITMQQLGNSRSLGGPAGALQALDQVIDRELLVQQALAAKLDRDPQVLQALDDARRRLLAQAWLEREARKARPGAEEVRAFYAGNPALFAERRIYRLRELPVYGAADKIDLIAAELASARDLEDVAGWLKWRNLELGPIGGATQAAEHLPLGWLARLSRMKEGQLAVFPSTHAAESGAGATVVQLVEARQAPLAEREAAPLIEQFLSGRKRLELAAAEVKRLRGTASIEYVGDFKR